MQSSRVGSIKTARGIDDEEVDGVDRCKDIPRHVDGDGVSITSVASDGIVRATSENTVEDISDLEARDMAERTYETPTKRRGSKGRGLDEGDALEALESASGSKVLSKEAGPPHWTLCRTWRPWPVICTASTRMLGGLAAFMESRFSTRQRRSSTHAAWLWEVLTALIVKRVSEARE